MEKLTKCIVAGWHMLEFQTGWNSEGATIKECTYCGAEEYETDQQAS